MGELKVKAVVLDLFDTLVRWEPSRLPTLEWQGRAIPSTYPLFEDELRRVFGDDFQRERFLAAYYSVVEEIMAQRSRDAIEITCTERFYRVLDRYDQSAGRKFPELAEILTAIHMRAVRAVTSAPPENVAAVRRIAARYRMGLLSNFDDAQTGNQILDDTGVAELFESVVISAEVGLRKPNPRIFNLMLSKLGLNPEEVLFVGDAPLEDVMGARQVGIPVAWLSHGREPAFAPGAEPDFTLRNLELLPQLLGV